VKRTATENRIAEHIAERHAQLLADLRLHVGIRTGQGNEAGLDETRQRLAERLEALGATTDLVPGDPKPEWLGGAGQPIPPTAVCRRLGGAATGRVLIAGHLDTVHDPDSPFNALTVAADGKTATGPGCVDMKGGLVIAVAALEALEACGVPATWTFTLNSDEETGTYHSETALRAEAEKHDFGIALEPALPGGELAVERMGSGQFKLECFGRSAHVGRDFANGVSAVNALAERIVAMSRMPDAAQGKILNVGPLIGGPVTNAVPDYAAAWGNVRFRDQATADELASQLDALATAADAPPEQLPRAVLHRSLNRPAKPLILGTERLARQAREVAEALGQSLPFAKTGGVCDGNILQDAGLPTIDTLGVRGGGLHTPDEWIELDSLVERCQLLAILIARLSAGGSEA